jgi:hypothetical protein
MSALALSRGEIITQGLSLAGRPDLVSDARLWLNLFLEKIYFAQDFDWLVKSIDGISTADGTPFPDDYRSAKSGVLVTPEGSRIIIQIISKGDEYDAKLASVGVDDGQPQIVYANHDLRQFFYLPRPIATYTLSLKYFYMPPISDYTDPSTDDDVPKWGLPSTILVDHIKSRAMEYNDDDRQQGSKQEVLGEIAMAKMNNHDRRGGPSRLPMGKRFTKRFR